MTNRWQFYEVKFVNVSPRIPLNKLRVELVESTAKLLTTIEEVILLPPGIDKATIKSQELIDTQTKMTVEVSTLDLYSTKIQQEIRKPYPPTRVRSGNGY